MTPEYKKQIELDAEKKYPFLSMCVSQVKRAYIAGRTEEAEKIKPLIEAFGEIINKIELLSLQYRFNSNIKKAKEALKNLNK